MRKLLNTLYVTTDGAYLNRDGEAVCVQVDGDVAMRVPIHTLDSVICIGRIMCTPQLLGFCADNDVSVSFLNRYGRYYARVEGPVSGNVLLRREQYRVADDDQRRAELARNIVMAKVASSRTVLRRAARDHPELPGAESVSRAADQLRRLVKRLTESAPLAVIRGIEGEAARTYFSVFDHMIVSQKDDFYFEKRTRRPPLDNLNALLSFVYTLVTHDAVSALQSAGLDPAVGFLHEDRPGRPGLALDLVEEFRAYLADRLVLSLVNLQQIRGSGMQTTESGAVSMDDETLRTVLAAYQQRKQDEIRHPFIDEKIKVGLLLPIQAMLMARHLRGDLEGYPPFVGR